MIAVVVRAVIIVVVIVGIVFIVIISRKSCIPKGENQQSYKFPEDPMNLSHSCSCFA